MKVILKPPIFKNIFNTRLRNLPLKLYIAFIRLLITFSLKPEIVPRGSYLIIYVQSPL